MATSESILAMRGSRKVYQRGSNFDVFFFVLAVVFFSVDEGRVNPNTTKRGHHWPASETPFKWRANDSPILNAGFVALRFSGNPGHYC